MGAGKGRRRQGELPQAGKDMSQSIDVAMSSPGTMAEGHEADLQSHIGRQLRAMYDTVVKQPIPDRFLELLSKLDEKSGEKKDPE